MLQADGGQEVYGGPLKAPQLRTFLDSFASQEPLPENAGRQTVTDPLSQLAPVVVHSLSSSNLTDIELQDDMWLIAFFATTGMQGCRCVRVGRTWREMYSMSEVTGPSASTCQHASTP